MNRNRSLLILIIVCLLLPAARLLAQDTTWVQTFTFDSLWTRRAKFFFPTANQSYRKILMYYDLKCYATVSGDNEYPCGQWDGVTNQMVYDHRGKLDSTLQNGHLFAVNGAYPDSIVYSHNPQYDLYKSYQYYNVITGTNSLSTYQAGNGSIQQPHPFNLADSMEHAQFIWKASEMIAAGLTAGQITGIQLQFANSGSAIHNLMVRVRVANTDSIASGAFVTDSLNTVFYYQKDVNTAGWNNIEFTQPYIWDGVSNLLIDFSYQNTAPAAANPLLGSNTSYPSGIYSVGKYHCAGNTNNNTGIIDFGQSLNMFTNGAPRTYEFWASGDTSGTVLCSGISWTNFADFSVKMYGGNSWSVSTWSWDDQFATANPQNVWKHYAVSYGNGAFAIYQNGQLVSNTSHALYTQTGSDFLVGGWYDNGDFKGRISNLRIWDTTLSPGVITSWMNKDVNASHPNYAHLKADYRMNEGNGGYVYDSSPLNQHAGQFFYNFYWQDVRASDLYYNTQKINWRPNIIFERGSYQSHIDSALVVDTVMQAPVLVDMYEHPSSSHIISDTSSLVPSISTGRKIVWDNLWSYSYLDGVKTDSTAITLDSTMYNTATSWYSNTVSYEIGRAITPYGIGLNMGSGKTWVYDVTDYYNILQDTVDFSSGGNWELENVKFAFIKGNAPAPVTRIDQPWGKGTISDHFSAIAANTFITPQNITLDPNTSQARMRTRITGHGAETSNAGGAYPHCCEFWDNTHYLYNNNQQIAGWSIFQDCALQPLYPQGGTWSTEREGWCPGEIVPDYSFGLTPYINGGALNIDYGISPVPADNPGMGNGAYVLALQLIEYGTPGRTNDAEMYDVKEPNAAFVTNRMNPICSNPKVVLRNAGSAPLTAATIKYKVSGGEEETYSWTGNLAFMDTATVTLPLSGPQFWAGDNSNVFIARVDGVNNTADEYAVNDTIRANYALPDNFNSDKIVIAFKTNLSPQDNTLTVTDFNGNIVHNMNNLLANHVYRDTLTLPQGCYTLVLTDAGQDGLTFWANTAQGSGWLELTNAYANTIYKSFNSDFGEQIYYPFTMGYPLEVKNMALTQNVTLSPNPNTGQYTLHISGYTGTINIQVTNLLGQTIMTDAVTGNGSAIDKEYSNQNLPKGVYLVRLTNNNSKSVIKMVVE